MSDILEQKKTNNIKLDRMLKKYNFVYSGIMGSWLTDGTGSFVFKNYEIYCTYLYLGGTNPKSGRYRIYTYDKKYNGTMIFECNDFKVLKKGFKKEFD